MRLIHLTMLLLFLSGGAIAQLQPIYYRFDKQVLNEINTSIGRLPLNDTTMPFIQWVKSIDTTAIMVTTYCSSCKSSPLTRIVENSNRFVMLKDDKQLPIVLSTDLVYTDFLNKVANEGTATENITVLRFQPSGWIVKFIERRGNMKIVSVTYFQR
ncbi:hypothetical protein CLV59_103415 [Chitinophaga dinghuensis]|uniref:Uncharacterized protein n=1 Tax=Chitinophaga dinghuensis TaxID=1539050 RepID=A0A327W2E5_9BACT|nr:hypothetical protein [Chitinophaga dinghuensis]RAJ83447.1 hypothetical protein CLV59_103415 [Chitinophaga dinghuensis]